MAGLVLFLLVLAWAWWVTRPAKQLDRRRPSPPAAPVRPDAAVRTPGPTLPPARRPMLRLRPSVRPGAGEGPLTEDELLAFGLALEASDDVLAELVRRP